MKYELIVKGQISLQRLAFFDKDKLVRNKIETTLICGQLIDQTNLLWVLRKLDGMGIIIVSYKRLEDNYEKNV